MSGKPMTTGGEATGPSGFTVSPPGFRLPADLRLGTVRLQVADLDRSVDYYQRVLGLGVLESTGDQAALVAQQGETPLIELNQLRGATPVPRRGRLGLYHFALLLPDRASLGRFLAHLGPLGEYAGMSDHLVSEALYLTDPDGLGIEVYADRPRASWRMRGRALAMATDPLDVDDLVRAGEERPWTGLPTSTRMGHVHLHVGDLGSASTFYHTALGLDRVVLDFPGALFMSAGGYHHHLGTNIWAAGAPPAAPGDARLLEWTLQLPAPADVAAAARSLRGSGYEVRKESGEAVVADPWGINLRLVAR
ncbi:MAG: VOC family protein [Gemmatimonadales bacterium]|nr:VOC family protein [Gemmatimonadales bacterium]